MIRFAKYALPIIAVVALALFYFVPRAIGVEGWSTDTPVHSNEVVTDGAMKEQFSDYSNEVSSATYEDSFKYLLEGYIKYRSPHGAYVFYPGAPSYNGRKVDGLEGFARFFPLAGAWLASGRSDRLDLGNREVVLSDILRQGLLSGTLREGPEYWGHINSYSQRLVEASDVALGLWLSRHQVWEKLDANERKQVVRWLSKALDVDTWPGTWLLFPVTVHTVLKSLGEDDCCHELVISNLYKEFKALYRGGGWFEDPPHGFDYYNAWAIHYSLFWIDQVDPAFDPEFIRGAHSAFVKFYRNLLSPRGVPMMGRSVCYRLATPVPLLTTLVLAPEQVSPGMAMRALDSVWGYFVGKGALRHGTITQGYCGTNLSILDNYSGPASCLWSARSLIVAFYLDSRFRLFEAKREPLPVETGDYEVNNAVTKWTVIGRNDTGEVVLTLNDNSQESNISIERYGIQNIVLELLKNSPRRPDNHQALYKRRSYSSHLPIVDCRSN